MQSEKFSCSLQGFKGKTGGLFECVKVQVNFKFWDYYSSRNMKGAFRKNILILKYSLILICLIMSIISEAQPRRFKHLTSEDGISQSEVYCFLKDSRGFIWFGTVDGLNRYDGYNIEVFNTNRNDKHTISSNTIRCLAEDQNGRIWIGTDGGLNVYDPKTELFSQIAVKTLKSDFAVWSLLIYNGQLLLGTNNGLWRAIIETNDLKKIESGIHQIKNIDYPNTIRSVIPSEGGGIWLLTNNSLTQIELLKNSEEAIPKENFPLGRFQSANKVVEDFSGNLWITLSRNGLIRYNPKTKVYKHFSRYETKYGPASEKCSSLALDKNGNLWVGTLDQGLNFIRYEELSKDEVVFETILRQPFYSHGLNSNLIYSLYVSEDNLLWVGTIGSGVNIFNPNQKKFEHYKFQDLTSNSSKSNFIRSVYVDNQNRIWTGTHNNGLFIFDRENENFKKLGFETQSVFYISYYKENKVFVCTTTGIFLVELVNNKLKIVNTLSIVGGNQAVFYIINSKPDIYWIATINGLVRVELENNTIKNYNTYSTSTELSISENNCRVLFYDHFDNKLYVGTEGGGLNIISLDNNHFPQNTEVYKNTTDPNSISSNYVRSIIKDSHQDLWIGTYEGLNKMVQDESTGKTVFRTLTKDDGLPNNMIHVLVEDNFNNLWIGTNGGLSQYIPEQDRFINYTASDGIQSNEFSEHAAFKKANGEILMAGINGINAFYPNQIEVSLQKPHTTITEFYLFNEKVNPLEKVGKRTPLQKSITLTDSIVLQPKQNNIGFDFSAMIYPSAEKVKYAYMLKGFDEDWRFTDASQRNANYTNLRHGDYTFLVKSTNNDGIWEDSTEQIFIHINTPFYLTWFAYVIYGLLIISFFVYFSYFSVIRYTTKKRLLLEKEHNQKLHELDVLRTKFFINISHDLRTPLTLISGPVNYILQNKKLSRKAINDNLILVKRNVKRLNYLVEQLLDVRKSESGKLSPKMKLNDIVSFVQSESAHFNYALKKKKLALKINSNNEKIDIYFDTSMISKVLFNIISNAIKFTEKGAIKINISTTGKESIEVLKNATQNTFVVIEITDTGKGIEEEQKKKIFNRFYQDPKSTVGKGFGIGLSHTKELIDAHDGFIEVESTEGVGTTFRFYLPKVKNVDKAEIKEEFSTEDIYIDEEISPETEVEQKKDNAKTILVVEDNADMRKYIKTELSADYDVSVASDGLLGMKKAESIIPDLILSDVVMPNLDGIQMCERIKSNIKTSHIPVVLLTAKVDVQTKYQGIEIGADDYIPKPLDMEYLKIRIKNLLQSRDQLRKLFQKNPVLEPSKITVTSVDEKFLSSLMEAIETGIPDPEFSVISLEKQLGMSHTSLYRKLKSLTGKSGHEILQTMRLKRAHQLLTETKGIRIEEVAYMVGFNSPRYFSKCFRETYGFTPSDIQKEQSLN